MADPFVLLGWLIERMGAGRVMVISVSPFGLLAERRVARGQYGAFLNDP
jgi:hypothetical protein